MRILLQASDNQVGMELLKEWNDQLGRIHAEGLHRDQHGRDHDAGENLQPKLGFSSQSQVALLRDLRIVIAESDSGKGADRKDCDPDKAIAQIRPKKSWHNDCDDDQQAAHRGRARFFLMGLRALLTDVLPYLEIAQASDDEGTDNERGEKGSQAGECGAERQITKNTKRRKVMLQFQKQEPIEQLASVVLDENRYPRDYREAGSE